MYTIRSVWLSIVILGVAIAIPGTAVPSNIQTAIDNANKNGPYLGLVIPNLFEMNPLLQHPSYKPNSTLTIDFAGKRFRFGTLAGEKVILVMTGLAMVNAAITTQLVVNLFNIKGVVHFGIAGNANPNYDIGDVLIPRYWAHSALWSWQRYGNGPENQLPLEASGDYTRGIGYFKFSDYAINVSNSPHHDNLLNNIWYQPEEIFPVDGTPEERQHVFWIPVDPSYLNLAQRLTNLTLERCINATKCVAYSPRVVPVLRGMSASIYLDNAAYRSFLSAKFRHLGPVDMESAAVALICRQQKVPFIIIRALSDLAGGGSDDSNEADLFTPLASNNSVTVVVEFVRLLRSSNTPVLNTPTPPLPVT
ncbi:bark storage protein A [Andrographis paniculata]|uniref:bark storage protein A n=1 Tax=Andrographis paniculata TaxID=175694 RepID=UPI0021E8B4F9|nr:bark storage protein A [Andrographis paniculata]